MGDASAAVALATVRALEEHLHNGHPSSRVSPPEDFPGWGVDTCSRKVGRLLPDGILERAPQEQTSLVVDVWKIRTDLQVAFQRLGGSLVP